MIKSRKEHVYGNAVSGDTRTYSLRSKSEINVVLLQEDITKGQRVESFEVEALTSDGWKTIAKETTIGYKRHASVRSCESLEVACEDQRLSFNGKYQSGSGLLCSSVDRSSRERCMA